MNTVVKDIRKVLEDALAEKGAMDKKNLVDMTIDRCIAGDLVPELLEAMSQLLVLYNVLYNKANHIIDLAESVIMERDNEK